MSYTGGTFAIDLLHPKDAIDGRRLFPDLSLSGRMTDVSNGAPQITAGDRGIVFQSARDGRIVLVGEASTVDDGYSDAVERYSGGCELFGSGRDRISPMCGLM